MKMILMMLKFLKNLFEKYYLQQNNIINLSSSNNISKSSIKSNLYSSQISNITDNKIEFTNYFTNCFHNSVVPYLSVNDLINQKVCSKLLNLIINLKAINICILSNSTKNFPSNEYRISVWGHYMGLKDFTNSLINQYYNKKDENKNKDLNEEEKEYYKYISAIIQKITNNEELIEEQKQVYTELKIKKLNRFYKKRYR